MTGRYTFTLTYRSATGVPRGTAVARNVRATTTQFVVERTDVEVTGGNALFGGSQRYDRRTLDAIPKARPLSGNGRWSIDRDSVRLAP